MILGFFVSTGNLLISESGAGPVLNKRGRDEIIERGCDYTAGCSFTYSVLLLFFLGDVVKNILEPFEWTGTGGEQKLSLRANQV